MSKPAAETRVYPSRAAASRAHRAHRDALIAELGLEVETPADPYLASTFEFERWVNERRASLEQAERVVHTSFTTSFNMRKVKTLTVFRFDADGVLIAG